MSNSLESGMTSPQSAGATPSTGDNIWTTRRLLGWMSDYLTQKGVDSPRVVAEKLLAHSFNCERMRLYMEVERPASKEELTTIRGLLKRAAQHEPLQYLFGEETFFTRSFEVGRETLIPRPCTETLVEAVLHECKLRGRDQAWSVADVGTGTGCIAITLALGLPNATVVATDLEQSILDLAARNAARHGVEQRIAFRLGSLFEPLAEGERFDVICSNPPYIPDEEWEAVHPNVKNYEPARALRGGADGLAFVRPLIEGACDRLTDDGLLAIEIAARTANEVIDLARSSGFARAQILADHEGLPRVLLAHRKAEA